jgi:hypothetical protein
LPSRRILAQSPKIFAIHKHIASKTLRSHPPKDVEIRNFFSLFCATPSAILMSINRERIVFMAAFQGLIGAANSPLGISGVWESRISTFFVARKSPKNAKNLFDASPYAIKTSDPIRAKNKNITGFGPRDLIDLDS